MENFTKSFISTIDRYFQITSVYVENKKILIQSNLLATQEKQQSFDIASKTFPSIFSSIDAEGEAAISLLLRCHGVSSINKPPNTQIKH